MNEYPKTIEDKSLEYFFNIHIFGKSESRIHYMYKDRIGSYVQFDLVGAGALDFINSIFDNQMDELKFEYPISCHRQILMAKNFICEPICKITADLSQSRCVSWLKAYLRDNPEMVKSHFFPYIQSSVDKFPVGEARCHFLTEFFGEQTELTGKIAEQLMVWLSENVKNMSVIDPFEIHLKSFVFITSFPIGRRSFVELPYGIYHTWSTSSPKDFVQHNPLGIFLNTAALPTDVADNKANDVVENQAIGLAENKANYLLEHKENEGSRLLEDEESRLSEDEVSDLSEDEASDLLKDKTYLPLFENIRNSSTTKIKVQSTMLSNAVGVLHNGLIKAVKFLVLDKDFSRRFLFMLVSVMDRQLDSTENRASLSFWFNLSAVMIRLGTPLYETMIVGEIEHYDIRYSLLLSDEKSLCATVEEFNEWEEHAEPNNIQRRRYFSKLFFLTVRILNVGLVKAISECARLDRDISIEKHSLPTPLLEANDVRSQYEKVDRLLRLQQWYKAVLFQDLQEALCLYRFMFVWLAELVGGFTMPLPSPYPRQFAVVPRFFVADALRVVEYASNCAACDGAMMEDFMKFIVLFVGNSEYIKGSKIRIRMIRVLHMWSRSPPKAVIFRTCKMSTKHLLRNLVKAYGYADVKGIKLYQKHSTRDQIVNLLQCLFRIPNYDKALQEVSVEEDGVYYEFLNFVLTDLSFLLKEVLKQISAIKMAEDTSQAFETIVMGLDIYMGVIKDDERKLMQKKKQKQPKREEIRELLMLKTKLRHRLESFRKSRADCLKLALQTLYQKREDTRKWITFLVGHLRLLEVHSQVVPGPFLHLNQVDQLSRIITKILFELLGSHRTRYILKDPHKCGFHCKELVRQVVCISVQLFRADGMGILPTIFRKEMMSRENEILEVFLTAAKIVHNQKSADPEIFKDFIRLRSQAEVAGEVPEDPIPEEYLDAITNLVMKDPVKLPSSKDDDDEIVVDRETITRVIKQTQRDPFTRLPLKVEDLIPLPKLKAKIVEFQRQRNERLI